MWRKTVREWLQTNDRSQAWLARHAGLAEAHFSRLMTQEELHPSAETLHNLEEAMGLPTGTLVNNAAPTPVTAGAPEHLS